ncbi:MAG: Rab family GTPase [Candidatus Helarchaeota archaeon]
MAHRYNFKIAVIGFSGVGKTSLINQFISKKFEKDYISTIGVNILIKDVEIEVEGSQYSVQLMFWDIGGQEKYTNVRHMFYKGANGAIIVYDTTRPNTFLEIPKYLEDLEEYLQKKIPFILLGNKIDLKDLYRVQRENAEELAKTTNAVAFFETSAKTGENVEKSFHLLAEICLKNALK